MDAFLFRHFGGFLRIVFVVFTIRNEDDGAAFFRIFRAERAHASGDGFADGRTLSGDDVWRDALQIHFGAHIIASDRDLRKRIACKNDQAELIVHHLVNKFG